MADLKTGSKFIEKDPPLPDQETKSIGRKILDYLAYLKEQLNFIFSNYRIISKLIIKIVIQFLDFYNKRKYLFFVINQ